MTINEFIKDRSSIDSPIGDLANDILKDRNFPSLKSESVIIEYLDLQTRRGGTNEIFQEFLIEYRKQNNETLKLILNYLKDSNISSIGDALEQKVATSFVESCGYIIKIPVGNDFPETVINDLKELETLNEKWVEISNGEQVQSHLITKPNISDGMIIRFCSQEVQFEFLLSLIE